MKSKYNVKYGAFEKDGVKYPTMEIKITKQEGKFGFIFGLSKARMILANIKAIEKFVNMYPEVD